MYVLKVTCFWENNPYCFAPENKGKLCNVWCMQLVIAGNNICQSDWCVTQSCLTIVRKLWPIKKKKEHYQSNQIDSLPPLSLKKHRKIIFAHLVPFWKTYMWWFFLCIRYVINVIKYFRVSCLLQKQYIV